MYKKINIRKSSIQRYDVIEGQTIEQKIERLVNNNEPIEGEDKPIYTDRKDGCLPDYNIRADKMELALEAIDKATANKMAWRSDKYKRAEEEAKKEEINTNQNGKPESTQSTE